MCMAYKDFDALIGMQSNSTAFADEIFGFHAQQTVEKALKAWMCLLNISYPFSHQVAHLLTILHNSGEEIDAFWPLDQYTAFAVQARYEAGSAELLGSREATIAEVRILLDQVENLIVKSQASKSSS